MYVFIYVYTFVCVLYIIIISQLDILLNGHQVDALSCIIHNNKAYTFGKSVCLKLKETIHRFDYYRPQKYIITLCIKLCTCTCT